jgi:hypothetical protein
MSELACRTTATFNRERDYLIHSGIPAEFILSARELNHADLTGFEWRGEFSPDIAASAGRAP